MNVIFKNISSDLKVIILFDNLNEFIEIEPMGEAIKNLDNSILSFSVKYERDFSFGYKAVPKEEKKMQDYLTEKITEKAFNSIGNAVLQAVNTYKIEAFSDNAVITVNDKAHLLLAEGKDSFFNCLPALIYFGQAETTSGNITVASSVCINRPGFLSLYKFVYRSINLHGVFFNFVKYKVQIKRQRKISSTEFLTKKFSDLYALSFSERDYQFKPLRVLGDKFLEFIKGKLPKRIYNKLVKKLKRTLGFTAL